MATSHVRISTHGVLFTGQARADIRRFLDETKEEVADLGVNEIQARLGQVLKSSSGHFASRVRTDLVRPFNDQVIHADGVIYGPWLESGKYSPPRRFKGYGTFRRVRQKLRKQAIEMAQQRLDELVARWNR